MYYLSVRGISKIIYVALLDVQCTGYGDYNAAAPLKLSVGARGRRGNFKDPQYCSISSSMPPYILYKLTLSSEASGITPYALTLTLTTRKCHR